MGGDGDEERGLSLCCFWDWSPFLPAVEATGALRGVGEGFGKVAADC